MKNILLISSLYPADDIKLLNNTAVCHYFAKEWIQMGYHVRVIFLYHLFPIYYYPILKLFRRKLANSSGIAVLDKYLPAEYSYNIDGIDITRIPIKKSRPGGSFPESAIHYTATRINEILTEESFEPNIILGHFLHPSINVISYLKQKYPVITAVSLHGKESIYNQITASLLKNIDYIGYRSLAIGKSFELLYGERPHFLCYSGVPQRFIVNRQKKIEQGARNFIFVGSLIKRKYPVVLLPAINNALQGEKFTVSYVGEGNEKKAIMNCASSLGITNNVRLCGRLSRENVVCELDKADVFIMISKDETFGLVYLEAMARGCIVIASRDEGMDGIIEHGVNGFLCKAGDTEELTEIIRNIYSMSPQNLSELSREALETARKYTDTKVAKEYISFIDKNTNQR